jgi:hypothetical protein
MAEERQPQKVDSERKREVGEEAKAGAEETELSRDLDVKDDRAVDDVKGGKINM